MSERARAEHILSTPEGKAVLEEVMRSKIAMAVAQARHEIREELADQSEVLRRAALLQLSGQVASAFISTGDFSGALEPRIAIVVAKQSFEIAKEIVRLSWGVEDQGDGPDA